MSTCGDSDSDPDEELPVFDFLQPGRSKGQDAPRLVDLTDSDLDDGVASPPPAKETAGVGTPDVMLVSSDSEDDAPYVPLAQRLKQRQEDHISSSSAATEDVQERPASTWDNSPNIFPDHRARKEIRAPSLGAKPPPKPASFAGSGDSSPAKKKRAKRTAEEVQASLEEAQRRRRDREERKLQQEKEKAERRALAEAAKALRPEESIKHMVVAVDPAVLQLQGGGALLSSLQALGCSCAIQKQPLPRSISWTRRSPSAQPEGGACESEEHIVMQMPVEDFCALVHSHVQEEKFGRSDSRPTLTRWVGDQQRRNPGKKLSLAVIGMEKYFRSNKSQNQKKYREAVAPEEPGGGKPRKRSKDGHAETNVPEVSRVQVEDALVHLQLRTAVPVHFLSSWNHFADHVSMATKAVAEAPFKRQRDQTGFSFHLESEWSGGHKVDRGGHGLLQVWKRQIQQLNRVSADMASTVLASYPSPQLLLKAYGRCGSEREKMSLLADLQIRRGEGLTSTTRRVGPELSKRIFLLMTSADPEKSLEAT